MGGTIGKADEYQLGVGDDIGEQGGGERGGGGDQEGLVLRI